MASQTQDWPKIPFNYIDEWMRDQGWSDFCRGQIEQKLKNGQKKSIPNIHVLLGTRILHRIAMYGITKKKRLTGLK